MKTFLAILVIGASLPVNAYENFRYINNRDSYDSQKGYAYENKCFRYEYRETYIPGNSMSPGYVKSYNEKISIPCDSYRKVFIPHRQDTESQTSYVEYPTVPKCTGSTTLGALIGGGIAASLSNSDAYAWTIPLGAVLGGGIGNSECN